MMNEPHSIRLREPWDRQSVSPTRTVFSRRFGRPTGIATGDRVDLVVEAAHFEAEIRLNGALVGRIDSPSTICRVDVTQSLLARNELVVTLETPQSEASPDGIPEGPSIEFPGTARVEIFAKM